MTARPFNLAAAVAVLAAYLHFAHSREFTAQNAAWVVLGGVFVAGLLWLAHEVLIAPVVDEDYHTIVDPDWPEW